MADTLKGNLIFKGEGKERRRHLVFTTRKGKTWDNPVGPDRLAPDLRGSAEAEIAVELETDPQSGKPYRIRREGRAWVESAPTTQKGPAQIDAGTGRGKNMPGRGGYNKQQSRKRDQRHPQSNSPNEDSEFHNPYNFIPAPPRDNDMVKKSGLGDCQPAWHDRYYPELYSGQLRLKMTVATPLLLPDTARVKVTGQGKTEHKSYPVRVDAEGNPYIDPTAVKGMLRSAYEAITNSRLSVFKDHDERLAFRMESTDGVMMVPARVEIGTDGREKITLYTGTTAITDNGSPPRGDAVCAAWLRYYPKPMNYSGSASNPQHKDPVSVWLEKFQHHRWDKKNRRHVPDFQYWKVVKIVPYGDSLGAAPAQTPPGNKQNGRSYHEPLRQSLQRADGYVCITNKNFDRKHDERVFFNINQPIEINLGDELRNEWKRLIEEYRQIHMEEINQGATSPPALRDSVWSRHITHRLEEESILSDATLCYARVRRVNGVWQAEELYPVMISRRLHKFDPLKMLSESLRPQTNPLQLSPADRVFGWVNQEGKGTYRGQLRIGAVECKSSREEAIEEFGEPGLPLAILGQPKPQQGRFYVAADQEGNAQTKELSTEQAGYNDLAKGLRGRKVYPHHNNLPNGYWNNPAEDRTQKSLAGYYQEYRRPPKDSQERDNQNRSVHGWVKPDTVFEFDIHFMNFSEVELGALAWLLQLPDQAFHRFGGGKPLGFGSVRLEPVGEASDVRSGAELIERYKSLDDDLPNKRKVTDFVTAFKDAVWSAYGADFREKGGQETAEEYQKLIDGKFNEVGFIAAFLRAAQGFNDKLPIHYPRTTRTPNPEGESFKWFVENARSKRDGIRHGYALGNLADDPGLPILEEG